MTRIRVLHWALVAIILSNITLISLPMLADDSIPLDADADLVELQRQEAQMKANFEKLNQSNPLLNQTGANQTGAPPLAGDVKPDAAFENLNKMMTNPALQGYMKIFSNPVLIGQVQQIIKHPNRQLIFFAEAVWLVLFLMFRAWCSAKIRNWFVGFIIRMITTLGYFTISTIGIPWILIGEPYSKAITTLFKSF